jgi:hypothetical protein
MGTPITSVTPARGNRVRKSPFFRGGAELPSGAWTASLNVPLVKRHANPEIFRGEARP